MKSLLFITSALGYGVGGSEKALIEMLKKLDLSKYQITVLSLNEAPEEPFYMDGITIQYGYPSLLHISTPLRRAITHLWQYSPGELLAKFRIALKTRTTDGYTAKIIWSSYEPFIEPYPEEFDVVVGYGLGFATFFATDKVKAKHRVLWMDNDIALSNVDIEFNRRFYETADAIAVVDKSQIDRFCSVYPKQKGHVFAVRNIIPFEEICEKARNGIGFQDDFQETRILSVGRLTSEKNFSDAVKAAAILKNRGYKFKWYTVGFGPLENELRDEINSLKIEDCFVLLGQKLNPYPFFAQTDIYVQTSTHEGSCITIDEAMVFHKPVVTTNFPPAYNKIVEGKNGFIVEMNAESIANGVEKLLVSKSLRDNMSEYQKNHPLIYDEIIGAFDEMIASLGE